MRKNLYLRAALYLLFLACASVYLLGSAGTWAKYAATGEGAKKGMVATFRVVANNEIFSKVAGATQIVEIPLVDTVLWQPNTNGDNLWVNPPAHPGTIVRTDGSLIAPGTGGMIKIVFQNYSEVAVRFFFDVAASEAATQGINGLTLASTTPSSAQASNPGAEIQFSRPTGTRAGATTSASGSTWGTLGNVFAYNSGEWYTSAATGTTITLPPCENGIPTTSLTYHIFWRWRFDNYGVTGATWDRDYQDSYLGYLSRIAATEGDKPALKLGLVFRAEQVD